MINMQPEFISTDDFFNYWGINLESKLNTGDNRSNFANMFLKRIEDRVMSWIDANTFRNIPWENLKSDYKVENEYEQKYIDIQKDYWRKALLEQAMYVFRNGDIGQDSGYDQEKGVIAPSENLQSIEICRPCINFLKCAGLYNHNIQNTFRYTSF